MLQQELALKMFTFCGWFFDSYTGIEAQQILGYAQELIKHTRQKVDWPLSGAIQDDLMALLVD